VLAAVATPMRSVSRPRLLGVAAAVLFGVYLLSFGKIFGDVALACALAAVLGSPRRGVPAVAAVGLFFVSFPPLAWPYAYVLWPAPLFYLWRYEPTDPRRWWFEAGMLGFTAAWLAAPFLGACVGRHGPVVQTLGCGVLGVQMIAFAAAVRRTRRWPVYAAALACAMALTLAELARVVVLDFPLLITASPAAPTPLAQWARPLTIFGVSALLHLIACLAVPDVTAARWKRWVPTATAAAVFAAAWLGGFWMQRSTPIEPLPLSALLVQPHAPGNVAFNGHDECIGRNRAADRLTLAALQSGATPDLIVWPEQSLARSPFSLDPSLSRTNLHTDLAGFYAARLPAYGAPALAGVTIDGGDSVWFNSACLVTPDGQLSRHDKSKLIVLSETVPAWMRRGPMARVLEWFDVKAPYTPGKAGDRSAPLTVETRGGRRVTIAVSLCYEMHFPFLPQYREPSDVVIHLTDESWFAGYEGHPRHGTWACQYRAIETRKWQLVCGNWANSAAIDPAGRIRAKLDGEAGTIDAGALP
jgi:apolipoprotein N-acyltransferase